ncbi:DUF3553 domain-containing protein [Mailhella massiliensis]|uniref:DUF3553 domain-containing protein n=1 Tax=Mailhella massiliensis TaxID=1903261 RepID=A0A921AWF4_9BACT|nr:DUF3553 domain-containing protein [Mailhella massiliensis]HJD97575.1 DUF3553 domain-containing protein [Mailhella massiliensis]
MEFREGDSVINPSMPQWGAGEVLNVSEGKVLVRFPHHGVRKVAASFLAMAATGECPEPSLQPEKSVRKKAPLAPEKKRMRDTPAQKNFDSGKKGCLVSQALAMLKQEEALENDDSLKIAERAADLAADAQDKARQDALRRRNTAILRFWRDVEAFLIPEVPRSFRPPVTSARRWETVSASLPAWSASRDAEEKTTLSPAPFSGVEGGELPWFRPLPSGFCAAWHIVYLGVLARRRITDIILEKAGCLPERPEESGTGEGCLAAVVLDGTGMPVPESYVPASFVPALARCLAGKSLDGLSQDMLNMQSDFDRISGSLEEPFRGPRIHEEIQRLFAMMNVKGEEERIVVRSVYFRPDPKGRRIDDVQNDLLNSFYLTDLDHLLGISRHGFSGVFARYLEGAEDRPRCDVLSTGEEGAMAREKALSLERLPAGRWPHPPAQQLLPAQLAALTEILHGRLTAVNGPPGTGKTRLACDIAAELVTLRAKRLAKLNHPFEAFTASGDLYPPKVHIMRGTCMVVAGSNNAAVENITRFLPSEGALSREFFPEAGYFPEVAAAVNAALAPADDEETPRPVWGLVAAVLGSAWNCEQFARSLVWGFRDTERNLTLPGMRDALEEFRSYEGKQKAREAWKRAKQDFLSTLAEVERRKEYLKGLCLNAPAEKGEEGPPLLGRFMALMEESRALRSASREEDGAARELAERLEALEELARKAQEEMTKSRKKAETPRFPCREFWKDPEWQLKSVWNDNELEKLRSRLFLQALRLHEWTVKACARESLANLNAVARYLRGAPVENITAKELWNCLFFIVPVVSSTLASFSRLFSGMGQASLDFVLLDEAGQATPQSAAGALWRAEKAAVIGDPQQIEPVVPQPASLLAILRERLEQGGLHLEAWSPENQSAQTLADRASLQGTWMDSSGRRLWTGYPLRAHHRCAEPMFSISNRIAYDGQMVQAKSSFPPLPSPLGESCWFHVTGSISDTQLVQEELACLRSLLLSFQRQWPVVEGKNGPREAGVFVISPFRTVARQCRMLLRSMGFPEEKVRCGTIHTFQGREADIVFLVLGSSPGQAGWGSRQWASRTPNILNVALTRARSLFYVVGNRRDWRRHPFFDILAEELPVREGA